MGTASNKYEIAICQMVVFLCACGWPTCYRYLDQNGITKNKPNQRPKNKQQLLRNISVYTLSSHFQFSIITRMQCAINNHDFAQSKIRKRSKFKPDRRQNSQIISCSLSGVLYTVFVITFVLSIIMNNCIVFTQRFEWLNMINIIKY